MGFVTKHKIASTKTVVFLLVLGICVLGGLTVYGQELEPRSLTNTPVGTNFLALGYGFAAGNILFDPALPLKDVNANTHALAAAYVRSINFFGMGAKFNLTAPFAAGDWEGVYTGIDTATSRTGMADLRFGFSFNFIGAPAIEASEFKDFEQKTIVGGSFQVVAPTGQYFADRLINLGSNRWAFRPQVGVSHKYQSWYFEAFGNVWLYTTNRSFWNGNKLEQNAIATVKAHIIKSFNNGIWLAVGCGYAGGGRSYVNDVQRDATISTIRTGAIAVLPINKKHSIKFSAIVAKRIKEGADFDAFGIAYQYVFYNKLR